MRAATPQTKARPIAAVPTMPAARAGIARKPSAIAIEPSSGRSRTSQAQESARSGAHPRSSRSSSTSSGSLRRKIATIRPRPMTTSQAATTITTIAKT